jgi:hypothetical protein
MPSTPDTAREALQAVLLPKLSAIEKDLLAFRGEVAQSQQELRAEGMENYNALRAEINQLRQEVRADTNQLGQQVRAEAAEHNQSIRAEIGLLRQELRADLDLKFSNLVNEIQKMALRTELTVDRIKSETETYVHRSITPLAERVAVLEMSLTNLKEKFEKAS